MKPICVKCERFYRPKRNGTAFIEMKPKWDGNVNRLGRRAKAGTEERDAWEPYKLWMGDLWECQGCGHELIVGTGNNAISERHNEDFAARCEEAKITIQDC